MNVLRLVSAAVRPARYKRWFWKIHFFGKSIFHLFINFLWLALQDSAPWRSPKVCAVSLKIFRRCKTTGSMLDMVDSSSLLYRLEMEGRRGGGVLANVLQSNHLIPDYSGLKRNFIFSSSDTMRCRREHTGLTKKKNLIENCTMQEDLHCTWLDRSIFRLKYAKPSWHLVCIDCLYYQSINWLVESLSINNQ